MRRIGNALLWIGVVVGVLSGVWLLLSPRAGGLPAFVGIGLIKLTFSVGLGLIAAGAVGLRLAKRDEARRLLAIEDQEAVTTGDRKAARRDARLRQ